MKISLKILIGPTAPAIAFAQTSVTDSSPEAPSLFWIVAQAIFALILVIGGIVLVVWVLKQFLNHTKNRAASGQNGNFTVIQRCNLSPTHTLYAVRFLDDLLVVGGSEDKLSVIHRYTDFTRWDEIKADSSNMPQNFGQIFRNSLTGKFPGKTGRQN